MASASTPTVWQRWLALQLRQLREKAGLTQRRVARELRCNVSKVSYIENAQRPVVPRDLDEVLLPLYNVPEEKWDRYLEAARNARAPRWWERYTSDVLALEAAGDLYVGLEQGAFRLRTHQSQYVPGLLQTTDYIRAVLTRLAKWNSEDEVDAIIELRRRRQRVLHRESEPLKLWSVLDEAVVRRLVGGPETMGAQVEYLIEAAQKPNIELQLLPFELGAHHGMSGSFTVIEFDWEDAVDRGVVFFESVLRGQQFVEDKDIVTSYINTFEELARLGLDREATVKRLQKIMKEYS